MLNAGFYPCLKWTAIALALLIVGWAIWEKVFSLDPADAAYHAGNTLFEDASYERAAERYRAALELDPTHIHALRGLARSLHMQGRHERALALYDEIIGEDGDFGAAYANRGILLDTMGRHEEALEDYEKALELDPELGDGPHWLTRFLRNQPEKPPTIEARAHYLREQFAQPPDQRVFRVPEEDARQRPYKQ